MSWHGVHHVTRTYFGILDIHRLKVVEKMILGPMCQLERDVPIIPELDEEQNILVHG